MSAVTNILWLNGGTPTGIGSADTVTAPGTWQYTGTGTTTFAGNVGIAGNLDVQGDITQRGVINLTIADPFIDLGLGNSTTTPQAGGFTVQMAAAAGVTAASVYRFVTTTQFEINDANATALAANQIIAITGLPAEFAANEGLYAVDSVSGTAPQVINIKATATASAPFLQTIFQNASTVVLNEGAAFQTQLSALAFANGSAFPDAGGTPYLAGVLVQNYAAAAVLADFTANAAWTAVGAGSTTLQNAYDNGPTIVTSQNPLLFTLSNNGSFDVESGAVNFGSGALSALSAFNVEAGTVAVISTGTLDLDASGALSINASSGAINIGNDGASYRINIGTAGHRSISLGSNAEGAYTHIVGRTGGQNSTGICLEAEVGAINIKTVPTAQDPFNSGNIVINATYGITDITGSSSLKLNSSGGTIFIGNTDVNGQIIVGSQGSRGITIGNSIPTTRVSIVDSQSFQVLSDVSPSVTPAGRTGCVQILAGISTNIPFVDKDLVMEAGHDISINADNKVNINGVGNVLVESQTELRLLGNACRLSVFNSTAGVQLSAEAGIGMGVESTAGVAARLIVTLEYASAPSAAYMPKVVLADANDATSRFLAVTSAAIAAGGNGFATTVYGTLALVTFTSTPVEGDVGKPVYLSETAGQASLTAPTTSGANVIRLGYLVGASGSAVAQIQFQPQFIAAIP